MNAFMTENLVDPSKRAKCEETITEMMKQISRDTANEVITKSDQSWEMRIPQLIASVKTEVMTEVDAKIAARDKHLDAKMAQMSQSISELRESAQQASKTSHHGVIEEVEKERKARMAFEDNIIKTVKEVQGEVLKHSSGSNSLHQSARPSRPGMRTSTGCAAGRFVPSKVFVQGFYNFKDGKGALRNAEREALSERLMAFVPEHLQAEFKLETRYNLTRRLVYVSRTNGGESCWALREALSSGIDTENIEINGCKLKVRVEEAPDIQSKKANFWKAVDALKLFAKAEDFIIEPANCGIYDTKNTDLMGKATVDSYEWNDAVVARALPEIDVRELKRASLTRRQ